MSYFIQYQSLLLEKSQSKGHLLFLQFLVGILSLNVSMVYSFCAVNSTNLESDELPLLLVSKAQKSLCTSCCCGSIIYFVALNAERK